MVEAPWILPSWPYFYSLRSIQNKPSFTHGCLIPHRRVLEPCPLPLDYGGDQVQMERGLLVVMLVFLLYPAWGSKHEVLGQEKASPGQMGPVSFLNDGEFPFLTGAGKQDELRGSQRCHQTDWGKTSVVRSGECQDQGDMKALAEWKKALEKGWCWDGLGKTLVERSSAERIQWFPGPVSPRERTKAGTWWKTVELTFPQPGQAVNALPNLWCMLLPLCIGMDEMLHENFRKNNTEIQGCLTLGDLGQRPSCGLECNM